ncbi:uncharacterized protein LOC144751196 [Ciona intestinalis]
MDPFSDTADDFVCTTCACQIRLAYKFCPHCGSAVNSEELLIKRYFLREFKYCTINEFMSKYHGIYLSKRTLRRRIKSYGLRRRSAPVDETVIIHEIRQKLNSSSCMLGYRSMWQSLRLEGYTMPRNRIEKLMKELDPEGCAIRQRRCLRRRAYHNEGPNHCWHIDGYDKLKPYGFAIHGCIDGWSRKIMWLAVLRSNNNPFVVAHLFLKTVMSVEGYPRKVRSDCGTENVHVAAAQCYLNNSSSAHIYGTSPHNQRIEAWWSFLRRSCTTWWINLFKDLIEKDIFTPGNQIQMEALWFCFSNVLSKEMDSAKNKWNTHYIRKSRRETVSGRPDELYYLPELHCGENQLRPIATEQIDHIQLSLAESSSNNPDTENNLHQEYFSVIQQTLGLRTPTQWHEAIEVYKRLIQCATDPQ